MNLDPTLFVLAAFVMFIGLITAIYHGVEMLIGWGEIKKTLEADLAGSHGERLPKARSRSRMEVTNFTDDHGMVERYIIEDPATDFRLKVGMSERDLIRFEPTDVGRDVPPPVQQRINSFPQQLLQDIEQRSESLEPRV